ncbi:hypothetical protein ABPG75_001061 [Micractinium tetrahymenae]
MRRTNLFHHISNEKCLLLSSQAFNARGAAPAEKSCEAQGMMKLHVALAGLLVCFLSGLAWKRYDGLAGTMTVVCPPAGGGAAPGTQGSCNLAGKYDLSHLTQPREQKLLGPIQDDEALFL